MKHLKYLIAVGVMVFSFSATADPESEHDTNYGNEDTLATINHLNLVEMFTADIDHGDLDTNGNLYVYEFGDDSDHEIPDYFSVGGDVHGSDDDVYKLFKNINNLSYGVFDSAAWDNYSSMSHGNKHHFKPEHIVGYSVVPIPPAVWLFGSGLLGLVAVARRKV